MTRTIQIENLFEEQVDFITNEYFSGFKRYKNWKQLPFKLKEVLPHYLDDKANLRYQLENSEKSLKELISLVFSVCSEIPTTDNINHNMAKLSKLFEAESLPESINEHQQQFIDIYLEKSGGKDKQQSKTLGAVFEDLKGRYRELQTVEANLRKSEKTLTLCCELINQYADDSLGVQFKDVKKSKAEIDRETKALKDIVEKKKNELKSLRDETLREQKQRELKDSQSKLDSYSGYKQIKLVRDATECMAFLEKTDFNNNEVDDYDPHLSKKLIDIIQDVQVAYGQDSRPWVIGYSGGKDSSAVASLVYYSTLALPENLRTKNIYVVASDTLVETPKVVDHIDNSLSVMAKQAERDRVPISTHKVVPKANQSFWACLLGKGYPAPTKSFRWCTERMKIDPVSDFIKEKISQHDEVIVALGSRSEESASRAQVIAKHKLENSRFARHTTLANAFIYTPIDTWSMDDVWKLLRSSSLEVSVSSIGIGKKWENSYDIEWENPWASKNMTLWNLYRDASDQGECPMVIDDSTPSCGNSRFGCWTCTVVTKDRAMESLIQNGEGWMEPLLKFRDLLAGTNNPDNKNTYRNYKRRTGVVSFQRAKEGEDISTDRKHVPGPYWLKYRKKWLKELLEQEKLFKEQGHDVELITEPELHAIRQEWLNDPNEPDWEDSLPNIYREVYGKDLNWVLNDNATFDKQGGQLLNELSHDYDVVPQMIMKLLDLEVSMEGLSRRSGIQSKITSILKQDWGTLEEIKEKQAGQQTKADYDVLQAELSSLKDKSNIVDKLLKKEF
ncbi:DNA phosphorothioation system sulfurtransferase DndC [Alteromonas ponticola]|uniref:DNA phosphorothioation system sulfurtransferase DndC n=1 Tax=Alteromonas aquimaris TaxID=2998417 RepID=A0ABT3P2Y5_9ALTE|nr:DNA phosphorothioation system sulfurtransferase DndC [Alteromonas aquimaris]MCW8107118.1 DNA phosphorothioation system sulfurtransferase DndC [Alteromonas aquimaris]